MPTYFARSGKLWKMDNTKQESSLTPRNLRDARLTCTRHTCSLAHQRPSSYDTIWSIHAAIKQRFATEVLMKMSPTLFARQQARRRRRVSWR